MKFPNIFVSLTGFFVLQWSNNQ